MKIFHSSKFKKMALLASVLVLMLALCGCRTRITNNDEVSNVIYDEEGWMQDEYNMRRDDLDLYQAKKPLFTGFGAPQEEDYEDPYYDSDAGMLEEYDPSDYEAYDEDLNEQEPPSEGPSSAGSGTSQTGSRSRIIRRTGGTSASAKTIEVTLEPNGGTCGTDSVKVRTGGTYGTLPSPTWEDHEFLGWYTENSGGSRITKTTKVTATQSHIIFAHWKETAAPAEDVLYTVIYTDGVDDETVFEDKSFANCRAGDPTPAFGDGPVRAEYIFGGWSPVFADTVSAEQADSSHTITYTATWERAYDVWNKTFTDTAKDLDSIDCALYQADDSGKDKELVNSCKGSTDGETASIAIIFDDDIGSITIPDEAQAMTKVIAVSNKAVKSTDDKELLYLKLLLLSKMRDLDIGNARSELGITTDDNDIVRVLKPES